MRALIETVLSALLVAAALFVLALGLPAVLAPLYGFLSQSAIALILVLLGGWLSVGVWAGEPAWRAPLVGMTVVAVVVVVVVFVQIRVFSS